MEHIVMTEDEAVGYIHSALSPIGDVMALVRRCRELENEIILSTGRSTEQKACRLRRLIADELGISTVRYKLVKEAVDKADRLGLKMETLQDNVCEKHKTVHRGPCRQCRAVILREYRDREKKVPEQRGGDGSDYRNLALNEITANADTICERMTSLISVWRDAIDAMTPEQKKMIAKSLGKVSRHANELRGAL